MPGMYIQSEGEYSYVMGQDKETLQHWFALIAGNGEIKWQVTNALPEYYCGATEFNGIRIYLGQPHGNSNRRADAVSTANHPGRYQTRSHHAWWPLVKTWSTISWISLKPTKDMHCWAQAVTDRTRYCLSLIGTATICGQKRMQVWDGCRPPRLARAA